MANAMDAAGKVKLMRTMLLIRHFEHAWGKADLDTHSLTIGTGRSLDRAGRRACPWLGTLWTRRCAALAL